MNRFLIVTIVFSALLITTCAKNSRKVEVDVSTEEIVVDPNLPHDYPHALIPPNATCTHGSTGMMKAEENPEGNAWFKTDASLDDATGVFEGLEGWVVEGKEQITSEHGEGLRLFLVDTAESSTLQARIELMPFADQEGKSYTNIHVAYRGYGALRLDIEDQ
ncbi:hypothetical protein JXM67_04640 [candidate division WOR-3 bacterium]|nr:hypothetical protein [candidate division WOR-3 bacterium]